MPTHEQLTRLKGHRLREGNPLYDVKAQRELDRLVEQIGRAEAKSALAMWEAGFAYFTIHANKLYYQDGYSSMGDWVTNHRQRSYSWARELIRFATTFTRDDVVNASRRKLKLGEDYVSLARIDPTPTGWANVPVFVPVEGEKHETRLFSKATEAELESAVQHQRQLALHRERETMPAEQRALVDELQRELADLLKRAGLEGAGRIEGRPGADGDHGKTMVELSVPMSALGRVLRGLGKLL